MYDAEDWRKMLVLEKQLQRYFVGKCDRHDTIVDLMINDLGLWILVKPKKVGCTVNYNLLSEGNLKPIIRNYFGYRKPVHVTRWRECITDFRKGRDKKIKFLFKVEVIHLNKLDGTR
jgi:D-alanine-D-alanine ligase-like ATP-grasp enzyme